MLKTTPTIRESHKQLPIWLAALIANRCEAINRIQSHSIGWTCNSRNALYTNSGGDVERIQPFGICLRRGETLAVSWRPGDTEYTLNVCSPCPTQELPPQSRLTRGQLH
jgi:hypothetical protein